MYEVAIPSYRRSNVLASQSLKLLQSLQVPMNRVTIFIVEHEDEICSYKHVLKDFVGVNLVIAPIQPGLHHMRNYITQYYVEGTCVLNMDDDIESIMCLNIDETIDDTNKASRYKLINMKPDEFMNWIVIAFETLKKQKLRLFGIYPVKNGFFMKDLPSQTYDLRFCVGAFWGCINTKRLLITLEEKEDFERTLLFWEKDGGVLRFNDVTIATKYYKTSGGMQARGDHNWRKLEAEKSCSELCERFPSVCRLYTGKKNGVMEVRLKQCKTM